MELVNISLADGYLKPYRVVYIKGPVTSLGCSSNDSQVPQKSLPDLNVTGKGSPFFLTDENRVVVVACCAKALMTDIESEVLGCESSCEENSKSGEEETNSICNGYKCCQARIPFERPQVIGINIEKINGTNGAGCCVAFLTNKRYTPLNVTEPAQFHSRRYATVELGWYFDTSNSRFRNLLGCINITREDGYSNFDSCNCEYDYFSGMSYRNCYCNPGYTGNPYLRRGCVDIDECKGHNNCGQRTCVNAPGGYGCEPEVTKPEKAPVLPGVLIGLRVLIFVLGILGLYKYVNNRRKIICNKKFFKRNGGLLLKQHLTTSTNGGNIERSRIFSSKELKKATDNFNKNRVLGQGGQGTVYKGMLVDGRIVAVKRSKVIDEDKMEEFINEIVLLSQINHRNIVKLLGCCLETEVPIMVYEYISNGDLFKCLHDESDDCTMTWEVRLRIAIEIAGALSYMHSALSFPIFHRDIKTTNMLLDDKYRAKVSDFGTSRSVTIDQTHLTTLVAGTFGYMDPEYFLSSQYTHKSDVYSLGVVSVELITGEKPLSRVRSKEGRRLATDFLEAMKENREIDLIDIRIKHESKPEQGMAVAKLARKCLNRKGKNRPNTRVVSIELEIICSSPKDLEVHTENKDEEEDQIMEPNIQDSS